MVNGHKPVENRDWSTAFRGRVLIHTGKNMTGQEYRDCRMLSERLGVALPEPATLQFGGIVGVATITDCVTRCDSPWFFGPCGFLMRAARPLPFVPCRGALGFFEAPPEVLLALRGEGL